MVEDPLRGVIFQIKPKRNLGQASDDLVGKDFNIFLFPSFKSLLLVLF